MNRRLLFNLYNAITAKPTSTNNSTPPIELLREISGGNVELMKKLRIKLEKYCECIYAALTAPDPLPIKYAANKCGDLWPDILEMYNDGLLNNEQVTTMIRRLCPFTRRMEELAYCKGVCERRYLSSAGPPTPEKMKEYRKCVLECQVLNAS